MILPSCNQYCGIHFLSWLYRPLLHFLLARSSANLRILDPAQWPKVGNPGQNSTDLVPGILMPIAGLDYDFGLVEVDLD